MTERCRERRSIGILVGGLMVTALVFAAACGDGEGDESVETSTATPEPVTSPEPAPSPSVTPDDASSGSATASPAPTTTSSATATTEPDGPMVTVYYSSGDGTNCGAVEPFLRTLADDIDIYRSTFQQLVAGPTAGEAADEVSSFFSTETSGAVLSAVLTDGLLVVDFTDLRPLIPNASTSCGSEALLAQLNSTAFQFDAVQRTRYLIEGSCGDFANWLQRECFDSDRSGRQLDIPLNERADGSGCTPSSADTLPAGRWFGFVEEAGPEQLTFDVACWFTGAAAAEAAVQDGEESPPPNDFHIRNESDRLRVHPVDSATTVEWLPDPGDPSSGELVTYEDWLVGRATRTDNPGVWLTTTDDSHVMKIEEQYVP